MQRNWLRPRWYVQSAGGVTAGTAYPVTALITQAPEGPILCSDCGRDCADDIGWAGDGPYWCLPCNRANRERNFVPLAPWRKRLQDLSIAYDNLYWNYCSRFGKRVPL